MMHYNHPTYHAVLFQVFCYAIYTLRPQVFLQIVLSPQGLVDQTFENPLQPEATPGRTLPLGTVLVVIAIVFHGM